jgi:antitoxin component of MazEF toxin-antitoxin module
MVKNLVKHGNSYALVIDKPILELLGITPDTPLEISTPDGKSLVVATAAPLSQAERQVALDASLADINQRFAHTLKRLAS